MPISHISAGDDDRDGEIGAHGAQPRHPAGAHQADRQPMLHDEQIGRARRRTSPPDGGRADSAAGPRHDSARYSLTVSVSMSPMPRRSRLPEVA